jgi:hypothetical protein
MKEDLKKTCSICALAYDGRGYDATPINHGQCCSECHKLVQRIRWRQTPDLYPVRPEWATKDDGTK